MAQEKSSKKNMIDNMVTKSIDSFLMAVELYNKPSNTLRVDSFCFFICNAWEMLFKAFMLKNNIDIYFNKKKNRTLSLKACLEKIITNDKDQTRVNLEVVIGLRHMAMHLVIPEYAQMMNEVFMACVRNYTIKLAQYFEININNKLPTSFITIFIPNDNEDINTIVLGKYGKSVLKKFKDTGKYLNNLFINNSKENKINDSLAISCQLSFKKVTNSDEADIKVAKVGQREKEVSIVKVPTDPNSTHPLNRKSLLKYINDEIKSKSIKFTLPSSNCKSEFTTHCFELLERQYKFKTQKEFCYAHIIGKCTQYTYSFSLVQKIITILEDDPEILPKIKKLTPGA